MIAELAGDLSIGLNLQSIAQSKSGNVTGVIYWKIGTVSFPENGWNDFVLVLINAWLESAIRLINRESTNEVLHFMDGPFIVKCKSRGSRSTCKFIESKSNDLIECEWDGQTIVFAKIVLNASYAILPACQQFKNIESELEILETNQARLRKLLL